MSGCRPHQLVQGIAAHAIPIFAVSERIVPLFTLFRILHLGASSALWLSDTVSFQVTSWIPEHLVTLWNTSHRQAYTTSPLTTIASSQHRRLLSYFFRHRSPRFSRTPSITSPPPRGLFRLSGTASGGPATLSILNFRPLDRRNGLGSGYREPGRADGGSARCKGGLSSKVC